MKCLLSATALSLSGHPGLLMVPGTAPPSLAKAHPWESERIWGWKGEVGNLKAQPRALSHVPSLEAPAGGGRQMS